eukprot:4116762-Pyramimonas_sp.AAC.1
MVATVAMTTARSLTAPMLIMPAGNNDDVFASAPKVLEGFGQAREDDARETRAIAFDADSAPLSPPASARARASE